ncbi:hypothetical protein SCP_1002670 [Sparassis crispa]|uniref:Uncharacterized protein n=1 Tax=Sparassis crispa TaxID=139825 RepID=A0A401GXU7_9APHY|nr:hypothetical protein SCP_1002670 [Sparassis crispa]GBE87021.1 hypothetical protein SCP_1002670 [Sparassis crispa]
MPQWYWTAYRSESARRMTRSDSRRSRHRRSDHGGAALRMDCSLFLGVPDGRPKIHTDRLAGYHICPPLRPSRQAAAAAARNLCQVAFEGTLSELPAAESPRPVYVSWVFSSAFSVNPDTATARLRTPRLRKK